MKRVISFFSGILMLAMMIMPVFRPQVQVYADDGFNGASFQGKETVYINYAYKVEDKNTVDYGLPSYTDTSDHLNTCANPAGATAIGYYDRTYTNLIPDFEPGRFIRDIYIYYMQKAEIQDVIDELYEKMGTNTEGNGTTANGFRNGLKSYINEQGYNVTYPSVVSSSALSFSTFKNAIDNNQVVVLFVSGYTLLPNADITVSDTQDCLYKNYYKGTHVLIAYGYRKADYYNAAGQIFRQEIYLNVATSFPVDPLVYIMLDDNTGLIEGNIINLY